MQSIEVLNSVDINDDEHEYVDFISSVYCEYYISGRHFDKYNALILYENDKKIAETEVELIAKMGCEPQSTNLINWPTKPKNISDKPAVFCVNRVNRVMKLFCYGVSKYNAKKARDK